MDNICPCDVGPILNNILVQRIVFAGHVLRIVRMEEVTLGSGISDINHFGTGTFDMVHSDTDTGMLDLECLIVFSGLVWVTPDSHWS